MMDKRLRNKRTGVFSNVRVFVVCLSLLQLVQVMGSGPRAIAIGTLMMAVSSFISALPQFIGCRYRVGGKSELDAPYTFHLNERGNFYGTNLTDFMSKVWENSDSTDPGDWFKLNPFSNSDSGPILCPNPNNKTSQMNDVDKPPKSPHFQKLIHLSPTHGGTLKNLTNKLDKRPDDWDDSQLYILIAIGSIIKGMGHSPLHPLGMSYIDDHATVRNSAVYIGVVSALSLLGPAFGFILGSLTTNTWVDWGWVPSSDYAGIDPVDKEWVGAWWLGYIVTAILLLFATFPFCFFPRSCNKEVEEEYTEGDAPCLLCFKTYDENQDRVNEPEKPLKNTYIDACSDNELLNDSKSNLFVSNNMTAHRSVFENQFEELFENPGNNNFSKSAEVKSELLRATTPDYNPRPQLSSQSWYEISLNKDKKKQVMAYLDENDWSRRQSVISRHFKNESDLIPYSKSEFKFKFDKSMNGRRHISYDSIPLQLQQSESLSGIFGRNHSTKSHKIYRNRGIAPNSSVRSKSSHRKASLSIPHLPIRGSVNLPMAVVGNLLGGWCIRRFNLNVHKTMCVAITGLILTLVLVLVLLVLGCDPNNSGSIQPSSNGSITCSLSCDCSGYDSPVCDVISNITYRSACHAGCTQVKFWRGTEIYSSCSCLIEQKINFIVPNFVPATDIKDRYLLAGPCENPDCSHSYLPIFVATMGFASLTAGLASTPSSLVILRIVPPTDKAIAIAVSFVFTRILAWIPSPVYVGSAIDASCLRWSQMVRHRDDVIDYESRSRHHCDMYDKDLLRRNFFAVTGAQLICGILFYAAALNIETRRNNICRKDLSQSLKTLDDNSFQNGGCKTTSTRAPSSDDETTHCDNEIRV